MKASIDGLIRWWVRLNDWLRAFLVALVILVLIHVFVFRWVTVKSTSMYATLLPDDLVMVFRWPIWTGFEQGDIAVFRDPLEDNLPRNQRSLLVKRIAALAGDTLEIQDGRILVNGIERIDPARSTHAFLVRLKEGHGPEEVLERTGLPASMVQPGRSLLELPLNRALADELERLPSVVSAEAMSLARGAPRHIFPFSQRYPWNSDRFGPIVVPARGDTLRITIDDLPLYDRIISKYEGHELSLNGNTLLIDGAPLDRYVVEQDYYFVLGDSRHHSADSRYWGFVPEDHLVGRAGGVLLARALPGLRNGAIWEGL